MVEVVLCDSEAIVITRRASAWPSWRLALVETSCHVMMALKRPQKSARTGTEVSCQTAGPPTHVEKLPWK